MSGGRSSSDSVAETALLALQLDQGVQLRVVSAREPPSVVTKLQAGVEGREDLVIRVRQLFLEIPGEPERHI